MTSPKAFSIKCAESCARIDFSADGSEALERWCSFHVALTSAEVSARLEVNEFHPTSWSEFMADLATNWKGWTGTKEIESIEGQLNLSVTTDSQGHFLFHFQLTSRISNADWRVQYGIMVEAAQLDGLAAEARKFFG